MNKKKVFTKQEKLISSTFKNSALNRASMKRLEESLTKKTNNHWYSRLEAANYLNVSTRQLDRYRKQSLIKAYQSMPNGKVRYLKTDLDKFLKIG